MNVRSDLAATVVVAILLSASGISFAADAPKPPRAARSVHLGYPAPKAVLFYNEMVVGESVNGSYFMAAGWNTGYFGVQQLGSPTNKVVLFSVWDPTKGDNANAVKLEDRVELLHEGEGVRIRRFGGEGTGGQCMAPFAWKIGETNRFLVRGEVQDQKTAYTAWVWRNDKKDWLKLATFRTRTGGLPLSGLYSFVEDFRRDTKSATERRRARFGNGWVQNVAGEWIALSKAQFTASSAEWEAKETIDAGRADDWFFLATGGETKTTTALRSTLALPDSPLRTKPVLNLGELATPSVVIGGAKLTFNSPHDYQVVQRDSKNRGRISITGKLPEAAGKSTVIEARIISGNKSGDWQRLKAELDGADFRAALEAPAGGWYRLEVRASSGDKMFASSSVAHVGIGEVFVVAGQSNSANHGEEKQQPQTGRVTAFDGKSWRLANDPQPGASGGGGSFLPPLGDALATRFDVPVGFIACGIGATSVREWLPKGATFPNPPTIESRVRRLSSGEWESKGEAFEMFAARMKLAGARGFRAVLWHQGESDANQRDTTRTLSGKLYGEYLETVIRQSRREIGWEPQWFVAQVSYHVPGDESSPDIRAAQALLWKDGVALEGPDSDALKGDLRERGGQGVHFSGKGLRAHAARWSEKITPWLEQQLKERP